MKASTKKQISENDDFGLFSVKLYHNIVYQKIALVGLFCLILLAFQATYLLIPYSHLIIICLVVDFFITFIFLKFYKKTFSLPWALIHNLTIGFVIVFLFVWTNDNLSLKPIYEETVIIEKIDLEDNKQKHNRGLEPVITVTIKGMKKKISYSKTKFKSVVNSKIATVKIKEGFWGYWVLTDIELI